jgi:hypothetical protein
MLCCCCCLSLPLPVLQLVRALQRGVLAGDTARLLMWRLCTPVDERHRTAVHPSMGQLLASILQRKEPQRRLQVGLHAACSGCLSVFDYSVCLCSWHCVLHTAAALFQKSDWLKCEL